MAHDMILDPTYFWATRVIDTLCAVIILLILCRHCYILYGHIKEHGLTRHMSMPRSRSASRSWSVRKRTSSSSTSPSSRSSSGNKSLRPKMDLAAQSTANWTLALNALTICFIVFSLVTITMLMLNIWTIFPEDYNCNLNVQILTIAFHLSKALFYGILIARLQVAFGESGMGYSKGTIYGLFAFVVVYTHFVVLGTPTMVHGAFVRTVFKEDRPWCHVHIRDDMGTIGQVGILLWIMMDMVFSVLLLYLFQHPLVELLDLFPASDDKRLAKFTHLIMKCLILCWQSILSSALALMLYLWRHIATLIEINLPFVCICVVLMHIKYESEFNLLCRPCIACYKCTMHRNDATTTATKGGEKGTGTDRSTKPNDVIVKIEGKLAAVVESGAESDGDEMYDGNDFTKLEVMATPIGEPISEVPEPELPNEADVVLAIEQMGQ